MIMFRSVAYSKGNIHKWMEALDPLAAKISTRSKTQPVEPALQNFVIRQKAGNTAILVCPARGNHAPCTLLVPMQPHGNSLGWAPACQIQNVRRNSLLLIHDSAIFADEAG